MHKYQRSKLEIEKNLPDQPDPGLIELESARVDTLFLIDLGGIR